MGIQTCLLVLLPVLSAQSSPVAALHAQSTYTLPCQVSVPCIGLRAQMQCLPKLSVSEPRDKTAWPIPTSCWYNDDPFLCQRISHSDCRYFCGAFLSHHALWLSQQLCIFHEVGKEATSGWAPQTPVVSGASGQGLCLCACLLGTLREDSWCRGELAREHLLAKSKLKVLTLTSKGSSCFQRQLHLETQLRTR